MYVCMYVCMYTNVSIYTYTYVCVRERDSECVFMCTYTYQHPRQNYAKAADEKQLLQVVQHVSTCTPDQEQS